MNLRNPEYNLVNRHCCKDGNAAELAGFAAESRQTAQFAKSKDNPA